MTDKARSFSYRWVVIFRKGDVVTAKSYKRYHSASKAYCDVYRKGRKDACAQIVDTDLKIITRAWEIIEK